MNQLNRQIHALQDKVIKSTLIAFSILSVLVYPVYFLRTNDLGFTTLFYVQTLCFISIVVLALFRNRLRVRYQILGLVFFSALALSVGMFLYGFLATGKVFVVLIPIYIAFVSGVKKAIQTLFVMSLIYALIAVLFIEGYLLYSFDIQQFLTNGYSWFGELIFYMILTGGTLYITHLFQRTIDHNLQKIELQNEELIHHQEHLESLVLEKTHHLDKANSELSQTNSDLQKALMELKQTQARMIQSEKMASLGVMATGFAHEINNPLNYIMGAYEGIKELESENQLNDQESITLLLDGIKTGLDKTSAIVNRINQFSQSDPEQTATSSLTDIIENCVATILSPSDSTVVIHKTFFSEEIQVAGDINGFHQVFLNILTNAMDAIADTQNPEIRIRTSKKGDDVVVEISDNVHGIETDLLSRVTDPFFTTKDPGKGTGLGLSVAYSIITEHGGNLEIDSTYGKGTKVIVTLKAHE